MRKKGISLLLSLMLCLGLCETITAVESTATMLLKENKTIEQEPSKMETSEESSTQEIEDFSKSYMSGKYYQALMDVNLTGDYRTDIIAIAESQIGYCESDREDQWDGIYPGNNNYTEYGRWAGSNGRAWCSEFASWCATYAGVPTSILHPSRVANIEKFGAPYHTWKETSFVGGNYTPRAGDLVLFAWTGTSTTAKNLSHTAIVYDAVQNGETVILTVIHGNSNDKVRKSNFIVNATDGSTKKGTIAYFVAPKY